MPLVLPTDAPGYKHFGEYDKDSKGSLKRFVDAFKANKEPKHRDKNVFVRAMKSFVFAYLNDRTKTIHERKDNICFVFDIIPRIADVEFRSTTFTAVTKKMKESLEVLFEQRTREQNLILFESVGTLAWRDAFRHHLLNNRHLTLSLLCGQTHSTLSAGMLDSQDNCCRA